MKYPELHKNVVPQIEKQLSGELEMKKKFMSEARN